MSGASGRSDAKRKASDFCEDTFSQPNREESEKVAGDDDLLVHSVILKNTWTSFFCESYLFPTE